MSDSGGTTRQTVASASLRSRGGTAILGLGVVATGLLVHYTATGAVADFLADALYAVLIYLIVVFVAPGIGRVAAAGISYGICVVVELAQLTDGTAAVVAAFPPAVLVLGNTFAFVDLIAYAVGVAAALACSVFVRTLRIGNRKRARAPEA